MTNKKHKALTRTEMKILIYNKVKQGSSYEDARKQVMAEINSMLENHNAIEKKDKNFKEEFEKLRNGKKSEM